MNRCLTPARKQYLQPHCMRSRTRWCLDATALYPIRTARKRPPRHLQAQRTQQNPDSGTSLRHQTAGKHHLCKWTNLRTKCRAHREARLLDLCLLEPRPRHRRRRLRKPSLRRRSGRSGLDCRPCSQRAKRLKQSRRKAALARLDWATSCKGCRRIYAPLNQAAFVRVRVRVPVLYKAQRATHHRILTVRAGTEATLSESVIFFLSLCKCNPSGICPERDASDHLMQRLLMPFTLTPY